MLSNEFISRRYTIFKTLIFENEIKIEIKNKI
jgi:hypothetical protein